MLASAQKILKVSPIPNSENIEVATVLGWEVVVKKGEYQVGDLCCYISIDTVVPETPEFEFLRTKKFKVKTIKLRGQISQGLIVPLVGKHKEGTDLTELYKIKKYEKIDNNPALYEKQIVPKKGWRKYWYLFKFNVLYKLFPSLKKKLRSPFPTNLVSITDEERIQNIPQVLTTHKGKDFVVSYKLDGSSWTGIHTKAFGKSIIRICSRRFELHDKNNDWYKVYANTNFKDEILKLVRFYKTDNIIVQGEAIGKFNGNHHNLQSDQIRLFNIYVDGKRINQKEFIEVCKANNIPHCPLYKIVTLDHTMEEIIRMSQIKDVINPNVEAEGLVWRSIEDGFSFKAINNNYLLKEVD
jgi:hypothetical protein